MVFFFSLFANLHAPRLECIYNHHVKIANERQTYHVKIAYPCDCAIDLLEETNMLLH